MNGSCPAEKQTVRSPTAGLLPRKIGNTASELGSLEILDAVNGLRSREFTAVELLAACQLRIADVNGGPPSFDGNPHRINAWVRLYPEQALAAAQNADRMLDVQRANAPLMKGIPSALRISLPFRVFP